MSISPETPQPNTPEQGAPQYGAPAPGAPQYGAPAPGAPQYGAPQYGAPAPQQGTNGLAIAGLILAFLFSPLGLILSIVALVQTRKRQQKGRGLAIAGVIISILSLVASIAITVAVVATVGKNVATVADPGCTAGRSAIMKVSSVTESSDPATVKAQMQTAVDELNAAAAKAEHKDVRAAMKALADDYNQIVQAFDTGTPPSDVLDKVEADGTRFDELCTIGGAAK